MEIRQIDGESRVFFGAGARRPQATRSSTAAWSGHTGQTTNQPPQRPLTPALQILEQVFSFDAGRDKFHSRASHFREESLSFFVDERHIAQVDHGARSGGAPGVLPTGTQLLHPGSRQLAAECPLLRVIDA